MGKAFPFLVAAVLVIAFVQSTAEPTFWVSFSPNFFADLFVGLLIAFVITKAIEHSKKRAAIVDMTIDTKISKEIWLVFDIKNTGKEKYDEGDIYWHVYVPSRIHLDDATLLGDGGRWGNVELIDGIPCNQYSGQIKLPIFPQRSIDLFRIRCLGIKDEQPSETGARPDGDYLEVLSNCYFRLSTAYGLIPNPGKVVQVDPDILPKELVLKIEVFRS